MIFACGSLPASINNFPSLPPSRLSYGMTLAWSLKPARSRSLAYGNLSCCKWSEKSPDPQNLYPSLSEVQREDCAIATVYGFFSVSRRAGWASEAACIITVNPGAHRIPTGDARLI